MDIVTYIRRSQNPKLVPDILITAEVFMEDFMEVIEEVTKKNDLKPFYDKFINSYKNDASKLTYLSMFLNSCSWYFYEKDKYSKSQIFTTLWEKHHDYCLKNLKGKDLDFYIKVTD